MPMFLFVLILLFDNLNGFQQVSGEQESFLGVVVRGGILVCLFPLLFSGKSNIYRSICFFFVSLFLFLTPYWMFIGAEYNFSVELVYLVKSVIYFFCVLNYFYVYRDRLSCLYLLRLVFVTAYLISIANIFCFLFGFGNLSYGDDFGFGYKVFFVDGNSLSIYMIMMLPLVLWYVFYKSQWYYYLSFLVIIAGVLLIGSRVAILGVVGVLLVGVCYIIFRSDASLKFSLLQRWGFCVVGLIVIYFVVQIVYTFIIEYDSYTISKFSLDGITSSRSELIQYAKLVLAERDGFAFFVGTGVSQSQMDLGKLVLGYPALKLVESDFYDAILFFGWLLGGLVILVNLFFYMHVFLVPYFKCRSALSFFMFMGGSLWMIAAITTGHSFFNAMLAPVFGVYIVLSENIKRINVR